MLKQRPLEDWRIYLRWQAISGSATLLSDAFVQENFRFLRANAGGSQGDIGRDGSVAWTAWMGTWAKHLGKLMCSAHFLPKTGPASCKWCRIWKPQWARTSSPLDWMSPETKARARDKLHATLNKIGYPEQFRDYSTVQITRDNLLADRQHAVGFEFERWVAKIGQPVDRTEWTMTPPTINAYEEPTQNTINFPAGMLQPPYFDMNRDDAVNYGDIGTSHRARDHPRL